MLKKIWYHAFSCMYRVFTSAQKLALLISYSQIVDCMFLSGVCLKISLKFQFDIILYNHINIIQNSSTSLLWIFNDIHLVWRFFFFSFWPELAFCCLALVVELPCANPLARNVEFHCMYNCCTLHVWFSSYETKEGWPRWTPALVRPTLYLSSQ